MLNIITARGSNQYTGMIIGIVIGALVYSLICGFICMAIARSKGRTSNWFWFGFFLAGILAIIIVAVLPDTRSAGYGKYRSYRPTTKAKPKMNQWICPACKSTNDVGINEVCYVCGKEYKEKYKVGYGDWKCAKCKTTNHLNDKACTNCGCTKEESEEFAKNGPSQEELDFLSLNGIRCQICGKKSLTIYKAMLVDSDGRKERRVCPDCLEKNYYVSATKIYDKKPSYEEKEKDLK